MIYEFSINGSILKLKVDFYYLGEKYNKGVIYLRKVSFLLIIAIFLSTYSLSFAEDNLYIQGESAILMDYDTKMILYEKNMDKKLYPASTTKIMTAILAIENGNLEDVVTVDQECVSLTEGSHIALEPGEKLTMEQMLYALLVQSANDSAFAIAKHVSGSIEGFVQLMNSKAKEIGALNTNFVNPNGLHDDEHVTTAHDLALIGQYAMENEVFRKFVNTVTYTIPPTNKKTEARYLKNTNKLLFSNEIVNVNGNNVQIKYDGAEGVKTGTTSHALNCLVSFAQKDGQRLIAVVLKANGANVYGDTHTLFNYGFNTYSNEIISYRNEFIDNIEIKDGVQGFVAGVLAKDLTFPIKADNSSKIERKIILRENLKAPISKGDILGVTEFYLDGEVIGKTNLISTMDIEKDPSTSFVYKILSKWYIFVFFIVILLRGINLQKRKKRRSRRTAYRMPY